MGETPMATRRLSTWLVALPAAVLARPASAPAVRPARAAHVARPPARLVRRAPCRPRPLPAGDDLGHRAAVPVARRDRDRVAHAGARGGGEALRRRRGALPQPRPAPAAGLLPLSGRPRG